MKPSQLRHGPFAFMDLLKATTGSGTTFHIGPEGVHYVCAVCHATFEQSDDAFTTLRNHEMQHGRGNVVDLAEIDGRTLRIVVWTSQSRRWGLTGITTPEIWAVDDEQGVVYHLSNAYQQDTIWKWRITSPGSGVQGLLNAAMPNVPK